MSRCDSKLQQNFESELIYAHFSQGCRGRSQLGQTRPEAGASREVVPALRPAMGEGLSTTPARLDRGGLLRAHGVRVQHEPATSEVGSVSLSGESELRVVHCIVQLMTLADHMSFYMVA